MNEFRLRPVAPGFTLLEVLIAIVVVSFGLLGLAGLQAFALKNNQSASLRVNAANLTNDIVDRMKSNYIGVVNGNYNQSAIAAYGGTPAAGCSNATGCTPLQLAQYDLIQWQNRVAALLPGGVGIVCLDSTPNDTGTTPAAPACDNTGGTLYTVKIWWYDDRTQANIAGNRKYLYTAFNP